MLVVQMGCAPKGCCSLVGVVPGDQLVPIVLKVGARNFASKLETRVCPG